jgi:hypothetical protein
MTDLSIAVVNWNTGDLLAECLESICKEQGDLDLQIVVVDNGSSDGSVEMLRARFPTVELIVNAENVGFARANNQALSRTAGRYVLLLNSDTQVLPGALEEPVRFMDDHPRAGLASVRLINPDGTFQASYTPFPSLWREFLILSGLGRWLVRAPFPSYGSQVERGAQRISGYVQGAYMLARRAAVEQVGGLDERVFMYAEDMDWCYRFLQQGWAIWYLPEQAVIHYGGASSQRERRRMESVLYGSRVYFFRKHYGPLAAISLKGLIYALTGVKIVVHRTMRLLTGGSRGRIVPGWRELTWAFRQIE